MNLGENVTIDLPVLLETRLLVQANSGGGKSWALRRLLEQTANQVQQLVIDPEGEFATLREKFDYVIAAPHDGDAVASPQTAALLARRLLETGVSAILDIYDLKAHERQAFVRRFLDALVNAPRKLWHPVLLVLDEAHVFCPQSSKAEAMSAVIDVATRGRKRGLCLVPATQRLSKLHKDVAAEMLNKLVGRTGLDVDVKRAADELGMSPQQATPLLRNLKPGTFYAYGPAISTEVRTVEVGPVATTHPKSGHRLMVPPPAPSARIRDSLAKLADLPGQAEQEAQDLASMQARVRVLERELRYSKGNSIVTGVPEDEVERRIRVAVAEAVKHKVPVNNSPNNLAPEVQALAKARPLVEKLARIFDTGPQTTVSLAPLEEVPAFLRETERKARQRAGAGQPVGRTGPALGLTGPEQRILDAIAWMNAIGVERPEQTAVAFLAGYTIGGGAWNNPRGSLRTKGYLEYHGQQLRLTDAGRALARPPEVAPGNEALHEAIKDRLPGPETKLLTVLLEAYPGELSNDELAARAGYAPKGGAYNNPRGRLRSLGLIEYRNGMVRARDILFPEN